MRSPTRRSLSGRFEYHRSSSPDTHRRRSMSNRSPVPPSRSSGVRDKDESSSTPKSRRPALERIAQSNSPHKNQPSTILSSNSGRLQDVAIQYVGEPSQSIIPPLFSQAAGTTHPLPFQSQMTATESEASLHGDQQLPHDVETRVHTSLRLGPHVDSITVTVLEVMPNTKPAGKRKTTSQKPKSQQKIGPKQKPGPKPRVNRSPLQGVSLRKQNATSTRASSSRKKLRVDNLPEFQDDAAGAGQSDPPLPSIIPAIRKNPVDFQLPPKTLP